MTFSMRSKQHCRSEAGVNKGFTLVEVMVALTIMALVLTVAFAGLRIGINGWERGQRAIDDLDHRSVVERLIQRQLAVAVPMPVAKTVMFRGSADRLEFVADYSLLDGPTDFRK